MEVEQPIVTSAEPEALSPRGHTWTFSGDFGVKVLVWWQSLTWYFSFKLGTVGDISWLELFWIGFLLPGGSHPFRCTVCAVDLLRPSGWGLWCR